MHRSTRDNSDAPFNPGQFRCTIEPGTIPMYHSARDNSDAPSEYNLLCNDSCYEIMGFPSVICNKMLVEWNLD